MLHPNASTTSRSFVAIAVYVVIRYVVRTPFGIALQGIRDEPVRMASLGYNVPVHRMLAFGLAGLLRIARAGCSTPGGTTSWIPLRSISTPSSACSSSR